MKYQMILRSWPDETQPIEVKHREFIAALSRMRTCWGFASVALPTPKIGSELIAVVPLKGFLNKGIRGSINYRFRPARADAGMYDDFFELEFNPQKVDYGTLVYEAFDGFITAFKAYRGEILDLRIADADFSDARQIDARYGVYRVQPVSFYDRALCARAFNLMPDEIAARLEKAVEEAKTINDGVRIIVSSSVLPLEEADCLTRDITRLLIDA